MHMKCLIALLITLTIWTSGAIAKTISVKYVGSVSLDQYDCQRIQSSFVNRACYDNAASSLVLLLKSTYYQFCGVPQAVYTGLINSESKGKYFNRSIKGRYDCS